MIYDEDDDDDYVYEMAWLRKKQINYLIKFFTVIKNHY